MKAQVRALRPAAGAAAGLLGGLQRRRGWMLPSQRGAA
jgi:hypothetical protein